MSIDIKHRLLEGHKCVLLIMILTLRCNIIPTGIKVVDSTSNLSRRSRIRFLFSVLQITVNPQFCVAVTPLERLPTGIKDQDFNT